MKKLLKRLCSAMVAAVMVMTMAPAAFAADGGAQFQNGPYLLAPKTNSMVVVWAVSYTHLDVYKRQPQTGGNIFCAHDEQLCVCIYRIIKLCFEQG